MGRTPLNLYGVRSAKFTEALGDAVAELCEALVTRLRFGRQVLLALNQADTGLRVGMSGDDGPVDQKGQAVRSALHRDLRARKIRRYRVANAVAAHQRVRVGDARFFEHDVVVRPAARAPDVRCSADRRGALQSCDARVDWRVYRAILVLRG